MIIQTIIDSAFRKNGINIPTDTQRANALELINSMISSWSAEGLIIPYTMTQALALIVGQGSYTIGSSGEFNTPRPIRIINAYIRDSGGIDNPVDVSMTKFEYDAISQKTQSGRPDRLYYDPQYPLGKIYFDCRPDKIETLYLVSEKPLTEFPLLSTDIDLPLEFKEPLVYNLAIRISTEEDTVIAPATLGVANFSKNTIENKTASDRLVRTAKLDSFLTRFGQGSYKINSE